jgi:hypothetical protein
MRSPATDITTAASFFGRTPGADRTLIDWPEMIAWFELLARHSPRLHVESIGEATEGGDMLLLALSSEETIASLGEVRQRRDALAEDVCLCDPANAHGRRAGDKTVVLLTAGIHATEVGGVQLMPELVAELATSGDPRTTDLLERILLLIVPTLNPDGMDLVHRWYRESLGTPAEGSEPPALYHRYAGHDNNRDWYTHALVETQRVVERVHNAWRPHIVLDLHQMRETAPRYVVPPYIDPAEPNLHPRINALNSALGAHVAAALVREGRRGACSGVMFDCYSPTRAYQHYHGGVRILAEAASAKIATPVTLSPDEVKPQRGFDPNLPSVHNPAPWPGGEWRLRDIMDYHRTTIDAVLGHAAAFRDQWLRDQWATIAEQVREPSPSTFVIAPLRHQVDPPAARALVELLRAGDVRVHVVDESVPELPAGSFLIHSNQPFGSYARALLDLTPYPVSTRLDPPPTTAPYDVTTHCLPIHMGVDVRRVDGHVDAPARPIRNADLTPFPPVRASEVSRDRWLAIDARSHASAAVVARALENGASVHRLLRPHLDGGRLLPTGTWLVGDDHAFASAADASQRAIRSWLVHPVSGAVSQRLPRIGVHVSWRPNASDTGWLRLALEDLGIPHVVVRDADIQCDALDRIDVLVVPHLAPRDLLEGNTTEVYPKAYAGGLGPGGITGIERFLQRGGHVVAIDGSARALIEALHLPVQLPLNAIKPPQFSCPGSIVRVLPDPRHPLTLGMDEPLPAFFINSTAFKPEDESETIVAAHYAEHHLLVSGWMHGEQHLAGHGAIIDLPIGHGRLVGIGFRPHYRTQMLAGYNVLLNALLRPGLAMPDNRQQAQVRMRP